MGERERAIVARVRDLRYHALQCVKLGLGDAAKEYYRFADILVIRHGVQKESKGLPVSLESAKEYLRERYMREKAKEEVRGE